MASLSVGSLPPVLEPGSPECQAENDLSPIHLSVSSLTLIPLSVLSVSVAPRGAASQRSHLCTALLCFPPTFCPPCPVGWRVTTDIYLPGYGVCCQTGKWLFVHVFFRLCVCVCVCVCVDEGVPFGAEWNIVLQLVHSRWNLLFLWLLTASEMLPGRYQWVKRCENPIIKDHICTFGAFRI